MERFVSTWASTSCDHDAAARAMQIAVHEVFGMVDAHLGVGKVNAETAETRAKTQIDAAKKYGWDGDVNTFREAMRDFVKAQYDETQDYLKSQGVTELCLFRGMNISSDDLTEIDMTEFTKGPTPCEIDLQPASSFSPDFKTAKKFGSTVFMVRVPASSILGSFHTGFGCANEHEAVLLASPHMKAVAVQHE